MARGEIEQKQSQRRGRPRIEIDWEEFDKLCSFQCTLEEIASWFGCTIDTIENAVKREKSVLFSEYYKKKAAGGKMSLRRKQFLVATQGNGNVSMLIWLGKQYLGQRDRHEISEGHNGLEELGKILKGGPVKTAKPEGSPDGA